MLKLQDLPNIALTFVIVGVVIAVGLAVTTDVKHDTWEDDCDGYWNSTSNECQVNTTDTTLTSQTASVNASSDAIEGTGELSGKLPLIGLVIGFMVLLGILMSTVGRRAF